MANQFQMIGFVTITDGDKARAFYAEKLGFEFVKDDGFALIFRGYGNTLRAVKMKQVTPQPFTVLGWEVSGIHDAVRDLGAKGVEFERYSFMPQDEAGVWTTPDGSKVAWFKDPDGNVLSVSEHPNQ